MSGRFYCEACGRKYRYTHDGDTVCLTDGCKGYLTWEEKREREREAHLVYVKEVKSEFARIYLSKRPRVHGVGIRKDKEGLHLVVSGTKRGLATCPDTYQGIRVVKRVASIPHAG